MIDNQVLTESFRERAKKVHVALPLRITYLDENVKTGTDMACTYDIDETGARVIGLRREARLGQIVMVERGRNKALFRICWIGDPESELRGQFGIECLEEDKLPWKLELSELDELYSPFEAIGGFHRRGIDQERRRVPRYAIRRGADLLKGRDCAPLAAQLTDLSQTGCRLVVPSMVQIGTEVEINFKAFECEISLQGQVRHADPHHSGIEFRSIRRGDRPLLECLLRTAGGRDRDPEAARWNFEVAAI